MADKVGVVSLTARGALISDAEAVRSAPLAEVANQDTIVGFDTNDRRQSVHRYCAGCRKNLELSGPDCAQVSLHMLTE